MSKFKLELPNFKPGPPELTPTIKLFNQLRHHIASSTAPPTNNVDSSYIVLVQTGAYCPIHLKHVRLFDQVRSHLHDTLPNHRIVAGYISPSHDIYVHSKLKSGFIPAIHRVEMARICTATSDWVDVDAWESMGVSEFVDFPSVTLRLREELRTAVKNSDIELDPERLEVWYLAGADLIVRGGGGFKRMGLFGVKTVCAFRYSPNHRITTLNELVAFLKRKFGDNWENTVNMVDTSTGLEEDHLSSTLVRLRLKEGKEVDGLVSKEVAEYLKLHGILAPVT